MRQYGQAEAVGKKWEWHENGRWVRYTVRVRVGFCRHCFGMFWVFVKVDAWDMEMQPEQLQAFREANGHGSGMGTCVHAAVSGTREDAAACATER